MLNKQKVKEFFLNPWVVTVGGGIILLGVPGIWDLIQKKEFLTTLKTVISFMWKLIIGFLNLQLRLWWILVAIAVGVLVLWIIVKIKDRENEPEFLKYTEDRFIQWKWSWTWELGYNKKWHVDNLMAHCPQCDTRMQHDTYEIHFRCPRCGFDSHDVLQNSNAVEAVIHDNLRRAEKKEAAQHK
ncbi:MAG: hypothetical protein IJX84_01345 [Clostridia bacterium]|nr:hypothetical protein [Clostridia bacterium]MBQ8620624.1 hypothetical protein [Clostridia bacterium]